MLPTLQRPVEWSYHPTPAEISDLCGETGSVTVWLVATDDCDNADSTQATFTIEDTIEPTITVMASDTTTEATAQGTATSSWRGSTTTVAPRPRTCAAATSRMPIGPTTESG